MAGSGGLIFGSNEPVIDDAVDGTNYCMGTIFATDADGTIPQIHWRSPTGLPGSFSPAVLPIQAQLWDRATSTIIGTAEFNPLLQGEWEHETVDWHIEAGHDYVISIVTDRYTATSHFFDADIVNGHITAPSSAGRYFELGTSTTPVMPVNQFNNGGYFIDFDFVADDEVPDGPTITVWNGTSEVSATLTVWNGTAEVAAAVDTIV